MSGIITVHSVCSNRRVGRTTVKVPCLGMGSAPIGSNSFQPVDDSQASETVRQAVALGVSFFDTAPTYGSGASESRLGAALAGIPRDHFVMMTKLEHGRSDGRTRFDFSRDGIRRSLEASLKRLQMERVDILLLHDPDDHFDIALQSGFPALAELRAAGVVGAIGVGMNQWQMLADFARQADFDCFLLAGRYTLLQHQCVEFLDMCQAKNISVFLGGVYNTGILATGAQAGARYQYRPAPGGILARVDQMETVCRRYGVPLRAAAAQFALAHPAVTALIIGMGAPAEVSANLAALQTPIPTELWADFRDQGFMAANAPLPEFDKPNSVGAGDQPKQLQDTMP